MVRQNSYIKNSAVVLNTLRDVHRLKDPVGKVSLFKHLLAIRVDDDDLIQYNFFKFASPADVLA